MNIDTKGIAIEHRKAMPFCTMLDESICDHRAKIGHEPTLIVLHPDMFSEWIKECEKYMSLVKTESMLKDEKGYDYAIYNGIRIQSSECRPRGAALHDVIFRPALMARGKVDG